jgi:hypothetical protein
MITASSFKAIAPAEGQTSPPPREGGCTVGRDNYGIVSCFNGEAIRSVTPETIAEIQKDIPSGARIKVWKTLHDGATAKTAQDLSSALTNAGYKVIGVGDFFGIPYFKGINAEKNEEVYSIYVGDPRL